MENTTVIKKIEDVVNPVTGLPEGYTLKGLRTFMGEDCPGFNVNLYCGRKKVCSILEPGDGGEMRFSWVDQFKKGVHSLLVNWKNRDRRVTPLEKEFLEKIKPVLNITYSTAQFNCCWNEILLFSNAVDLLEETRRMRKICKTKTLFTLKSQPEQVFSLNRRFTVDLQEYLVKLHGNDLSEILNETRCGQKPAPTLTDADKHNLYLKGLCKHKTIFRLIDTPKGSLNSVTAKYTPEIKKHLETTYGNKLVEIYNERFLK